MELTCLQISKIKNTYSTHHSYFIFPLSVIVALQNGTHAMAPLTFYNPSYQFDHKEIHAYVKIRDGIFFLMEISLNQKKSVKKFSYQEM